MDLGQSFRKWDGIAGAVQAGCVVRLIRAMKIVRRVRGVSFRCGFVCLSECIGARGWGVAWEASRMRVIWAVSSRVGGRVPVLIAAYVTSTICSISASAARERSPVLPIFY